MRKPRNKEARNDDFNFLFLASFFPGFLINQKSFHSKALSIIERPKP
jgi:hypothetical protein